MTDTAATQRHGAVMDMKVVNKEVIGAITLMILLAIMFAYFFGAGMGCFGNQQCMEVRDEVERLVDNVNEVCQQSTLGSMDSAEDLPGGEYNFEGASALHISEDGDFTAAKFRDPGSVVDVAGLIADGALALATLDMDRFTKDWEFTVTAEECDQTHLCVGGGHLDGCHQGFEESVSEAQGRQLPFFVMDYTGINAVSSFLSGNEFSTTGQFSYYTPESRVVNLNFKAIQLL